MAQRRRACQRLGAAIGLRCEQLVLDRRLCYLWCGRMCVIKKTSVADAQWRTLAQALAIWSQNAINNTIETIIAFSTSITSANAAENWLPNRVILVMPSSYFASKCHASKNPPKLAEKAVLEGEKRLRCTGWVRGPGALHH